MIRILTTGPESPTGPGGSGEGTAPREDTAGDESHGQPHGESRTWRDWALATVADRGTKQTRPLSPVERLMLGRRMDA